MQKRILKKAVCAVLSTEAKATAGEMVDLLQGTRDLLSKCKRIEREMITEIGRYLLAGESSYPEWYIRLRALKNGIPKREAPLIMYTCGRMQSGEETISADKLADIYLHLCKLVRPDGTDLEEIQKILRPVLKQITELWREQARGGIEEYGKKREWLRKARIPEGQFSEWLAPLAEAVFSEIENDMRSPISKRFADAIRLLNDREGCTRGALDNQIEAFISKHFEAYPDYAGDDVQEGMERTNPLLTWDSFRRVVTDWEIDSLKGESRQIEEIEKKVCKAFERYKNEDGANEAESEIRIRLNTRWVGTRVREMKDGERPGSLPGIEQIRELAQRMSQIDPERDEDNRCKEVMAYIKKHYLTWIMEEAVCIGEDKRFLELSKQWIEQDLIRETNGFDAAQMETLETNLIRVLDHYRQGSEAKNKSLSVFRRIKAEAQLAEMCESNPLNDRELAVQIIELHQRLREEGVLDDADELNRKFTEAMQPLFMEWSLFEPAFCREETGRYSDDWFVSVAEKWLSEEMYRLDINAAAAMRIESGCLAAFRAYRVPEEKQNSLLSGIRRLWGDKRLNEIRKEGYAGALAIASVHDRLRRFADIVDSGTELEKGLRAAILEIFAEWGTGERPFASNEEQKYTDPWFISIAEAWIGEYLNDCRLNSEALQNLEKNCNTVLNAYKAPREVQQNILLHLQKKWGEEKLLETLDNRMIDETAKAVQIAEIHCRLSRIPGVLNQEENLEEELTRRAVEFFLAWWKAAEPFASGENMHYEDNWFLVVADAWLKEENDLRGLSSVDLKALRDDLVTVYSRYRVRERMDERLKTIWVQWGETKLQELQQAERSARTALQIAEIHNRLHTIPEALNEGHEREMTAAMLDCFVEWSKAGKPFASGEALRYEDPWFGTVLNEWIETRMEQEDLSYEQLSALSKQVETACRMYRGIQKEDALHRIKKFSAETYVREHMSESSSEEAIGKMAELLFKDQTVSEDPELTETIIDYLASVFAKWAALTPPFRVGAGNAAVRVYGQHTTFLTILQRWQEQYLDRGEDLKTLTDLREAIRSGFETFKIPVREFAGQTERLEYLIQCETFEAIRNQPATEQQLDCAAAIRMWMSSRTEGEQGEETSRICEEIDSYLTENMELWIGREQPLYITEYGYKAPFVLPLAEQWIENHLERREWTFAELQEMRRKLDSACNGYRRSCGQAISREAMQKLYAAECRAFLREMPENTVEPKTLTEAAERLAKLYENGKMPTDAEEYKQKLAEHYLVWLNCEPPFDFGSGNAATRSVLLPEITAIWVKHHDHTHYIPIESIVKIRQTIADVCVFSNTDENKELLKSLEMMHLQIKLTEITAKGSDEYGKEDLMDLAEIYAKSKAMDPASEVYGTARERLADAFRAWGTEAGFELRMGLEKYYEQIDLADLAQRWIGRATLAYEDLDVLREKLCPAIKRAAGRLYYHIESEIIDRLIAAIEDRGYNLVANQMMRVSEPDEQLLCNAIQAYAGIVERDRESRTGAILKGALIRYLDKWIDLSIPLLDMSIPARLVEEWFTSELAGMRFESLADYQRLREKIERQIGGSFVLPEKQRDMRYCLEVRWLAEAIRHFDGQQAAISEIAAVESRVQAMNMELSRDDRQMLEHFLLDQFKNWCKEGYRSENGNEKYAYRDLAGLAKAWMSSGQIAELSAEKLDRIYENLTEALTEGYRMDKGGVHELLKPIEERRIGLLFNNVRETANEQALTQVIELFENDPKTYYASVFELILDLARRGKAYDAVVGFISLTNAVWQSCEDEGLRAAVMVFINELFDAFSSSDRPETMQETMDAILKRIRYDLSPYTGKIDKWMILRDRHLDRAIRQLINEAEAFNELPDIWRKEYQKQYSSDWSEVIGREGFVKALRKRLITEWDRCEESRSKTGFILSLAEFTCDFERSESGAPEERYKGLLVSITEELLKAHFDTLYAEPANREKLDEVIRILMRNRVDMEWIYDSLVYIRGMYCGKYEQLTKRWEKKTAAELLRQRPRRMRIEEMQIEPPREGKHTEEALLMLSLLYFAPCSEAYWAEVLNAMRVDSRQIDEMDAEKIQESRLIERLYRIYHVLHENSLHWAIDDLKDYLKNSTPKLWKTLHPFNFLGITAGNTWKKIGGELIKTDSPDLQAFKEWLLKSK